MAGRNYYPPAYLFGLEVVQEEWFVQCGECGKHSKKRVCGTKQMQKQLGFTFCYNGMMWKCAYCNDNMELWRQLDQPWSQLFLFWGCAFILWCGGFRVEIK